MASSGAAALSEKDLLSECWSSEPSLREDGVALYHALSLAALLSLHKKIEEAEGSSAELAGGGGGGSEAAIQSALELLISLLHAERAFLFEAKRAPAHGEPRLGRCLASWNLDGEPVQQPERKAPLSLLEAVAESWRPAMGEVRAAPPAHPAAGEAAPESRAWQEGAAEQRYHYAAFPLESGEGILFVENRFQPLEATRESLRLASMYSKAVSVLVELLKLRKENASLWMDLSRLRESAALEKRALMPAKPRDRLKQSGRTQLKGDYSLIIGASSRMIEIFQILDRISSSNAPVLINGESGTGKELIAHAVHENSPRRGKVFVSENCGALTETLLESELFGYVKGAFTGANKDHKGLFELAIGGTLFLDEVGDMSPGMQKKLLRVLQEGVIRRVGGKDYVPVDVRIISATNKALLDEVHAGNFREDLYYRLNVINLKLPHLRERKEDIPELVDAFLAELEKETGIKKSIEPAALQKLVQYTWPGNIRELRNEIKRFFALSDGDIRVQDLSETILVGEGGGLPLQNLERELSHLTLKDATERLEKEMIRNALIHSRGNKSLVAKMLQVPKTSLYTKINKYGFDKL
jgi:transcriptional regulator with PAS, ATPase and Fis domain